METIEKPTTINSDSAPLSYKSDKRILSIEEQKSEINNKYLTSLSSFQKISIKLKDENNDDLYKEICPDVNYQEFNIGYYIFYNNNLEQLKELYEFQLKKLIKTHPVVLYHIKDFLNKLDQRYDEDTYFNPVRLFSLLVSYSYQSIVENARNLANNLIKINEIKKKGTDIKSIFSQIIIRDRFEDIFKEINDKNKFYYLPETYSKIENEFAQLEYDCKDKLSYINELEKILDNYYEDLGEVSIETKKRNGFCFILNRASYYLERIEDRKETYDLPLLKKLDKLRRKINILLLEFRYKFGQNSRPILDIEIARYKTLNNDFSKVSIYLDKGELKIFIKKLEEAFQNKASNLKENNNFEFLNVEEIKEIAVLRNVKIISNNDLKDGMKEKIEELKLKKKAKENEIKSIYTEYLKSGISLAVNCALGNELKLITDNLKKENNDNITKKGDNDINTKNGENDNNLEKKRDEGQSRIDQLQIEIEKIENNIQNYFNKIEKINIDINYDVTFINILKLYFKLIKEQYQVRYDFEGIIITEKKSMALIKKANDLYHHYEEQEKLREYEIIEISKDN